MIESFRGNVAESMSSPDGNEKSVGDRVAAGTNRGAGSGGTGGSGKDKGIDGIANNMEVIASCGTKIGEVDRVMDGKIMLKGSGNADGKIYYFPTEWVNRVDSQVHLTRNSAEARCEWNTDRTLVR